LRFTSDPSLSNSQILAALGGQALRDAATGDTQTGLQSLFARVLTNQVGASVFQDIYYTTGLDIVVDYDPAQALNVVLRKQVGRHLEATFIHLAESRAAGTVASTLSPPQYELRLGYNLSSHFRVSLSTDDQNNYGASIEEVHSF